MSCFQRLRSSAAHTHCDVVNCVHCLMLSMYCFRGLLRLRLPSTYPSTTVFVIWQPWARIHESVITYDGHISRTGITELELGPSENSYSRAGRRSVIVVLEVGGFHTGCLVTKRCTAHGRRGLFVQLDNQVGSGIIT